jgi:RimJ/RimL family protein N-acetyltransferase
VSKTLQNSPIISLRKIEQEDSHFLFSWANEEAVIKGSFLRSTPVTFEQHDRWFRSKICDPTCFLFIIEDRDRNRVGQIRFDLVDGNASEAYVAIGIAPEFRKLGYATEAIRIGSELMFSTAGIELIHACIKPFNKGSERAFHSAGYESQGSKEYEGIEALYVTKCNRAVKT